jgi:hypothetical protein
MRKKTTDYEKNKVQAIERVLAWPQERKDEYKMLYESLMPISDIAAAMSITVLDARQAWRVICSSKRTQNEINKTAALKRKARNRGSCSPKADRIRASEMVVTLEGSSNGELHNKIRSGLGDDYKVTKERITYKGRDISLFDAIREANRRIISHNRKENVEPLPLIDTNPAWIEGL